MSILKNQIFLVSWLLVVFSYGHEALSMEIGSRYNSFGGAYRAVASASDIILYNPAGIMKKKDYKVGVDYMIDNHQKNSLFAFSASDSLTSSLGLGVLYSLIPENAPYKSTHQTFYLAGAYPVIPQIINLGISGHYRRHNGENYFNASLGVLVDAKTGFSFAIVGDDLVAVKKSFKPTSAAFGLAYDFAYVSKRVPVTMAVDWVMKDLLSDTDLQHELNLGAEYAIYSVVPVRLGFNSLLKNTKRAISIGGGFVSEQFGLDVFYKQNLSAGKLRYFGLGLHFSF